MDLETFTPYFIVILPILIAAWIGIRVSDVRAKQQGLKAEYDRFKNTIWPFIHSISSGESTLNVEILQHFPEHKNAAREYAQNLKGKQLKKFMQLWCEYEYEHSQVKSLGVFAPAVAIAPSNIELKSVSNSAEMERWEIDRINKICSILQELLNVAKIKVWF